MTRLEVRSDTPSGSGASVKVDGVEMARSLTGLSLRMSPNAPTVVALDHFIHATVVTTEAEAEYRVTIGEHTGAGRTLRVALLDLAERVA